MTSEGFTMGPGSALHELKNDNNNNNNNNESKDLDNDDVLECRARIISFFAHKGGVSKTTNVYHLSYMLSKQYKYKVLMIDADPQQNLTQTCCISSKNNVNFRDGIPRGTLYTAVKNLHYGKKNDNYILPGNCIRLKKNEINNGGELWLLPGSLQLAKLEPQITFAHNISNPHIYPLFNDIAGGFRHLFISTCAHYDIDFAIIDMGPSIGELNKNLFWSSDYFIIPCSPDSYCKTTMKTMERTLPIWAKEQKRLYDITKNMRLSVNNEIPKFMGIIFGMFQVGGKNKKPIKNSGHWMEIIKQTVKNDLIPKLKDAGMLHSECNTHDYYTLAEIPHFLSLMPIAQRCYSPVYDIPIDGYFNEDEYGNKKQMNKNEIKRHMERAKYFGGKYSVLAKLIIDMLQNEQIDDDDCNDCDGDHEIVDKK